MIYLKKDEKFEKHYKILKNNYALNVSINQFDWQLISPSIGFAFDLSEQTDHQIIRTGSLSIKWFLNYWLIGEY